MVGALLIVRLSSSRLPAKNMMPILGKPMIQHLVERVQLASLVDKVIITTSDQPSDDPLEALAETLGVACYRGSLDCIMERIAGAIDAFDCEHVVEILGDNPLIHSDLIDDAISFYQTGNYDYVATVTKEYPAHLKKVLFSLGVRVQVYSAQAARAWKDYPEYWNDETKGTTAFIYEHPERFKIGFLEAEEKWRFMNYPDYTFAVNYQKNFDLVKSIFEKHYPLQQNFSLQSVYDQIEKEPELLSLMGSEE